jgi:hypothetical protein
LPTFWFHKRQAICWPCKPVLASQEELNFMDLVSWWQRRFKCVFETVKNTEVYLQHKGRPAKLTYIKIKRLVWQEEPSWKVVCRHVALSPVLILRVQMTSNSSLQTSSVSADCRQFRNTTTTIWPWRSNAGCKALPLETFTYNTDVINWYIYTCVRIGRWVLWRAAQPLVCLSAYWKTLFEVPSLGLRNFEWDKEANVNGEEQRIMKEAVMACFGLWMDWGVQREAP